MQRDNIQTDSELRQIETIKAGLEEIFEQKVTITLDEIFHLFDGETEPRHFGYGYKIELETPVYGKTQLASHLNASGLTGFWEGFSFGFFYGKMVKTDLEREYDEAAISNYDFSDYGDSPF